MSALAGTALNKDAPVVFLNNAVRQREAKAGSLSNLLGGEERVVDSRDVFGCDSNAGVPKIDYQRAVDRAGVYGQLAAVGHSVTRVQDQVHENLLKL